MVNPTLIDLASERIIAEENINLYLAIKELAIETMHVWPDIDGDHIIDTLCEKNDMKRDDFNLVCDVEKSMFEDFVSKNIRRHK